MSNHINMEIAALMRQFPFKYPAYKYGTPSRRFAVILNEMYEMGAHVAIRPVRERKIKLAKGYRYCYRYQVEVNFVILKTYRSTTAAKSRMFREYLKLRQNEKKE